MRSKNACKTCALGMGGQRGGMVNELGHFPEVCKKVLQAMVADMQGPSAATSWQPIRIAQLQQLLAARTGSLRPADAAGASTRAATDYYRPITWDEALEQIAAKLRGTIRR